MANKKNKLLENFFTASWKSCPVSKVLLKKMQNYCDEIIETRTGPILTGNSHFGIKSGF